MLIDILEVPLTIQGISPISPLSSRVTDGIAAMVAFINGACMALMATSAQAWNGTARAQRADIAVTTMQFVLVCGMFVIEDNRKDH